MATRSSISIRNEDGTYTGIYAHWDGYLSNNGRILEQHYTNEEKIRQLMALGSLSSLRPEIGERQDFNQPTSKDWCLAYGRDRGEDDVAQEAGLHYQRGRQLTVGKPRFLPRCSGAGRSRSARATAASRRHSSWPARASRSRYWSAAPSAMAPARATAAASAAARRWARASPARAYARTPRNGRR